MNEATSQGLGSRDVERRPARRLTVFDGLFLAASAIAFAGLLLAAGGLTFFADAWSVIEVADDWSFDALMQPHNAHWMLGLRLVFQSLLAVFGLGTYVPFMVVLLLLHLATAAALYTYARSQTPGIIALGVGLVFLFLGSGGDNFFMAFQISWSGAAAAGTWALVILLREPPLRWAWVAAILYLVAVATSGVGLFFLAAGAAILLISESRRRQLWVVAPAAIAYAAWYIAYGSGGLRSLAELPVALDFARVGIANAIGQVSGYGPEIGLILGVLLGVAAVSNIAAGSRLRPGLVTGSVGLVTQFGLTALARAQIGIETAIAPRYVYPAAIFILIGLVGWLAYRSLDVPGQRFRLALVTTALVVFSLGWNLGQMAQRLDFFAARADETRAAISLALTYGGSQAFPADRGFTVTPESGELRFVTPGETTVIPGSDRLGELIERMGSPLGDSSAPSEIDVPAEVIDGLFARVMRDQVTFDIASMPAELRPVEVEGSTDLMVEAVGPCLRLAPNGQNPSVVVRLPSGSAVYAGSDAWGAGEVFLSLRGTYGETGPAHETAPDTFTRIGIPSLGPDGQLLLRYVPTDEGSTLLCVGDPGS